MFAPSTPRPTVAVPSKFIPIREIKSLTLLLERSSTTSLVVTASAITDYSNPFGTAHPKRLTGEARKTGFFWLLVHFNSGLQNGFMLQCLDLRKINEAKAGISRDKKALIILALFA